MNIVKRIALGTAVLIATAGIVGPASATQPPAHCKEITKTRLVTGSDGNVYKYTSVVVRCRGHVVGGGGSVSQP